MYTGNDGSGRASLPSMGRGSNSRASNSGKEPSDQRMPTDSAPAFSTFAQQRSVMMSQQPPALGDNSGSIQANANLLPSRPASNQQQPPTVTPKQPPIETLEFVIRRTVSPPTRQNEPSRQAQFRVPSFHPIESIGEVLPFDLARGASDFDLMDASFDRLLRGNENTQDDSRPSSSTVSMADYGDIDFDFDPVQQYINDTSTRAASAANVTSALVAPSGVPRTIHTSCRNVIEEPMGIQSNAFVGMPVAFSTKLPMRSRKDEIREVFKLDYQDLLEEALTGKPTAKPSDPLPGAKSSVTKKKTAVSKSPDEAPKSVAKSAVKAKRLSIKHLASRTRDPTKFLPSHIESYSQRLKEAADFKREHGHCNIPHHLPENNALSRWAKRQRYQYKLYMEDLNQDRGERKPNQKRSSMTPERIEALDAIGFCWNAHDSQWKARFEELKAFIAEKGHPNANGCSKLATWVKCQRRQRKLLEEGRKSNITLERIRLLDSVGFYWNMTTAKATGETTEHVRSTRPTRSSSRRSNYALTDDASTE